MAQNKFETEIKNQLNSREIQPSVKAWDRLDAMLSIAEKPKKKYPWLLIAASFIGFMFIGTMVFKSNSISSSPYGMPNATIQTPNIVVSSNEVEVQNQNSKAPDVVVTSTKVEKHKINSEANKVLIVAQNSSKKPITINQSKNNNQQQSKEGVSITNQNQIAVNQKQEITNQTSINQEVSSTNKDEILALVKPKVTYKTSLKVNPASLLAQVDGEVTTEFRENVFTKVSKSFQTVKVALADRNNTK